MLLMSILLGNYLYGCISYVTLTKEIDFSQPQNSFLDLNGKRLTIINENCSD